jgi:hypothetical protein
LQAISARIGRLHERLNEGDPDLEPDEIQAAMKKRSRSGESRLIRNPP